MKSVRITWTIWLLVLCSVILSGTQSASALSPGIDMTQDQTVSGRSTVLNLFVHMEEFCSAADIRLYYPEKQLEVNKCELTNKEDSMLMRFHAKEGVLRIAFVEKTVNLADPEIKISFRSLSTDAASFDVSASVWFYGADPKQGGTEYTDTLTIETTVSNQSAGVVRATASAVKEKKQASGRQKVSGRSLASSASRNADQSNSTFGQQSSTVSAVIETTEMSMTDSHPIQKEALQTEADYQQIGLYLSVGMIVLAVLILAIRRWEQLRITGGNNDNK